MHTYACIDLASGDLNLCQNTSWSVNSDEVCHSEFLMPSSCPNVPLQYFPAKLRWWKGATHLGGEPKSCSKSPCTIEKYIAQGVRVWTFSYPSGVESVTILYRADQSSMRSYKIRIKVAASVLCIRWLRFAIQIIFFSFVSCCTI